MSIKVSTTNRLTAPKDKPRINIKKEANKPGVTTPSLLNNNNNNNKATKAKGENQKQKKSLKLLFDDEFTILELTTRALRHVVRTIRHKRDLSKEIFWYIL